jgi:hypothetical protein
MSTVQHTASTTPEVVNCCAYRGATMHLCTSVLLITPAASASVCVPYVCIVPARCPHLTRFSKVAVQEHVLWYTCAMLLLVTPAGYLVPNLWRNCITCLQGGLTSRDSAAASQLCQLLCGPTQCGCSRLSVPWPAAAGAATREQNSAAFAVWVRYKTSEN